MGAANLLSVSAARRYQAVPVGYVDHRDAAGRRSPIRRTSLAIDDIQMITGLNCQVAVAARRRHRGADRAPQHARARGHARRSTRRRTRRATAEITELRESADDAPVIKLVYSILGQAVERGRLRHPLRARRGRDAGAVPRRRRAPRGGAGAAADGRRRRLAREDHERARHRREARAAGRPRVA